MKASEKLKKIKVGDKILFEEGDEYYIVRAQDYRYSLASTDEDLMYTIIDRKERVLAGTTSFIEMGSRFTDKEECAQMFKDLHSGEKELSKKYRDTFDDFDLFVAKIGADAILY